MMFNDPTSYFVALCRCHWKFNGFHVLDQLGESPEVPQVIKRVHYIQANHESTRYRFDALPVVENHVSYLSSRERHRI